MSFSETVFPVISGVFTLANHKQCVSLSGDCSTNFTTPSRTSILCSILPKTITQYRAGTATTHTVSSTLKQPTHDNKSINSSKVSDPFRGIPEGIIHDLANAVTSSEDEWNNLDDCLKKISLPSSSGRGTQPVKHVDAGTLSALKSLLVSKSTGSKHTFQNILPKTVISSAHNSVSSTASSKPSLVSCHVEEEAVLPSLNSDKVSDDDNFSDSFTQMSSKGDNSLCVTSTCVFSSSASTSAVCLLDKNNNHNLDISKVKKLSAKEMQHRKKMENIEEEEAKAIAASLFIEPIDNTPECNKKSGSSTLEVIESSNSPSSNKGREETPIIISDVDYSENEDPQDDVGKDVLYTSVVNVDGDEKSETQSNATKADSEIESSSDDDGAYDASDDPEYHPEEESSSSSDSEYDMRTKKGRCRVNKKTSSQDLHSKILAIQSKNIPILPATMRSILVPVKSMASNVGEIKGESGVGKRKGENGAVGSTSLCTLFDSSAVSGNWRNVANKTLSTNISANPNDKSIKALLSTVNNAPQQNIVNNKSLCKTLGNTALLKQQSVCSDKQTNAVLYEIEGKQGSDILGETESSADVMCEKCDTKIHSLGEHASHKCVMGINVDKGLSCKVIHQKETDKIIFDGKPSIVNRGNDNVNLPVFSSSYIRSICKAPITTAYTLSLSTSLSANMSPKICSTSSHAKVLHKAGGQLGSTVSLPLPNTQTVPMYLVAQHASSGTKGQMLLVSANAGKSSAVPLEFKQMPDGGVQLVAQTSTNSPVLLAPATRKPITNMITSHVGSLLSPLSQVRPQLTPRTQIHPQVSALPAVAGTYILSSSVNSPVILPARFNFLPTLRSVTNSSATQSVKCMQPVPITCVRGTLTTVSSTHPIPISTKVASSLKMEPLIVTNTLSFATCTAPPLLNKGTPSSSLTAQIIATNISNVWSAGSYGVPKYKFANSSLQHQSDGQPKRFADDNTLISVPTIPKSSAWIPVTVANSLSIPRPGSEIKVIGNTVTNPLSVVQKASNIILLPPNTRQQSIRLPSTLVPITISSLLQPAITSPIRPVVPITALPRSAGTLTSVLQPPKGKTLLCPVATTSLLRPLATVTSVPQPSNVKALLRPVMTTSLFRPVAAVTSAIQPNVKTLLRPVMTTSVLRPITAATSAPQCNFKTLLQPIAAVKSGLQANVETLRRPLTITSVLQTVNSGQSTRSALQIVSISRASPSLTPTRTALVGKKESVDFPVNGKNSLSDTVYGKAVKIKIEDVETKEIAPLRLKSRMTSQKQDVVVDLSDSSDETLHSNDVKVNSRRNANTINSVVATELFPSQVVTSVMPSILNVGKRNDVIVVESNDSNELRNSYVINGRFVSSSATVQRNENNASMSRPIQIVNVSSSFLPQSAQVKSRNVISNANVIPPNDLKGQFFKVSGQENIYCVVPKVTNNISNGLHLLTSASRSIPVVTTAILSNTNLANISIASNRNVPVTLVSSHNTPITRVSSWNMAKGLGTRRNNSTTLLLNTKSYVPFNSLSITKTLQPILGKSRSNKTVPAPLHSLIDLTKNMPITMIPYTRTTMVTNTPAAKLPITPVTIAPALKDLNIRSSTNLKASVNSKNPSAESDNPSVEFGIPSVESGMYTSTCTNSKGLDSPVRNYQNQAGHVPIQLGLTNKLFTMTGKKRMRNTFLANRYDNKFTGALGFELCVNELRHDYFNIRRGALNVSDVPDYLSRIWNTKERLKWRRFCGIDKLIEVIFGNDGEGKCDEQSYLREDRGTGEKLDASCANIVSNQSSCDLEQDVLPCDSDLLNDDLVANTCEKFGRRKRKSTEMDTDLGMKKMKNANPAVNSECKMVVMKEEEPKSSKLGSRVSKLVTENIRSRSDNTDNELNCKESKSVEYEAVKDFECKIENNDCHMEDISCDSEENSGDANIPRHSDVTTSLSSQFSPRVYIADCVYNR